METIIYEKHDYIVRVEIKEQRDIFSLQIFSVWPKARTDTSPHKDHGMYLPRESLIKFANFILQECAREPQSQNMERV